MTLFPQKYRFAGHAGIQVALFVVLLVVASVLGGGEAEKAYLAARSRVENLFSSGEGAPPDPTSVDRAEETVAALSSSTALLESRLGYHSSSARSPETVKDANDFAAALQDARRELEGIPASRSVRIPPNLGFPDENPSPAALPAALVRLVLAVREIGAAIRAGVSEVTAVGTDVDPDESGAPYLREVPVRFGLRGPSRSIAAFLDELGQSEGYVALREAKLASRVGRDEVDLSAVLAALLVNPAAAPEQFGGAGSAPGTAEGPTRTIDDLFRRR
ncbi:MAG: hypothetical protein HY720_30030 [Planctomycetes bacterium]|nr:hypothetical protein [Planctomycetota bacterium]